MSWSVNLAYPEPPVGLVMDQSLQKGLVTQTESTEEELSSPMAICVMIMRSSATKLTWDCMDNCCSMCATAYAWVCVCVYAHNICSCVYRSVYALQ